MIKPSAWIMLGMAVLLTVGAAAIWRYLAGPEHLSQSSDTVRGSPAGDMGGLASPRDPQPRLPPGLQGQFTDVTAAAGIRFRHVDGATKHHYMMETMGSGLAWIDYDQDGLMDLFLVQGSTFVPPHSPAPPTCKLYKNLGNGRFQDVTDSVGLTHAGCGQGAAVGDFDNDGFPDLFLTCFGKPNVLYHNVPDGKGGRRFVDITAAAGMADHPDWHTRPNWSTSAAFLDYDNDGLLDLFVCSYVKIDFRNYPDCPGHTLKHTICKPTLFEPTRCLLYRNNGNGTFSEVGQEAGIALPTAKALGVVALDLDDDGLIDIFVANDGVPNFLFRNLGKGKFEARGPASGCAVNADGVPQAYMGVDADDLDGDGRPDLFSTAFSQETNTLFRNEGEGLFQDITRHTGLGPPSWWKLGFGTCFVDVDHDGWLDIAVANGHVDRTIAEADVAAITFRQTAQLFHNQGRNRFQDISSLAGPYFQQPRVGRGMAVCDYDNDGSMDLAITHNADDAVLLHNEWRTPYHWVRIELRGTRSNRDAVGAKVTLHLPGGRQLVRHRKSGGSYLSSGDPRLLVGLGTATQVERIEIRWPSGLVQKIGPLSVDRGYLVVEGDDKVKDRP